MNLDPTSGETRGAHEGGGAPPPPGRAPCLMGPLWLLRRTSYTHIYRPTLKLPEERLDRDFRRQKPP